ncbi:MAG: HesA/MoeB/ThiF family protein [Lachnospiraceae bacterium]|nr:HesA/MoeB/ThiF family protein [Lachnospiraceae bacterium]
MFSEEELERYSRQILVKEIGMRGQKALKEAKVLVVGAGGLGSPALMYLAGAGVGKIGIVDADCVDYSNLHRQILYTAEDVGKEKAVRAAEILKLRNASSEVVSYPVHLTAENICDFVEEYDFIIDGVDNFPAKFLINDACVLKKKPFSHAGVIQLHGQLMTYVPGKGPCYRCIFEEIPGAGVAPNCSVAGVAGPVVGVIGSLQALEAVKYFTGAGELLTGKLLTVDGLTMKMRAVHFKQRRSCPVCGEKKTITEISNENGRYEEGNSCCSYTH